MIKKAALFIWHHFEEILLVPSLAFSVGLLFVQIIMRGLFNQSITWSEEMARYLFVWQCWLGIAYSTKKGTQLRINIIHKHLRPAWSRALEIVITLVWMAFSLYLVYRGFELTNMITTYGQTSAALRIPMQYCYGAMPVGALLMFIRLVEAFYNQFLRRDPSGRAEPPEAAAVTEVIPE